MRLPSPAALLRRPLRPFRAGGAALLAAVALAACQRAAPPPYADAPPASSGRPGAAPDGVPGTLGSAVPYLDRAFAPSHLDAADAYLDASGLQRDFEERLRGTLAARIAPPTLGVAFAWQAEFLGSAATRPAFARLLADRLSEAELRSLATTGLPPDTSGFDRRLVALVEESRALGAALVDSRRAELEAMLREAARQQQAAPAGPSGLASGTPVPSSPAAGGGR